MGFEFMKHDAVAPHRDECFFEGGIGNRDNRNFFQEQLIAKGDIQFGEIVEPLVFAKIQEGEAVFADIDNIESYGPVSQHRNGTFLGLKTLILSLISCFLQLQHVTPALC